MKKNNKKGFTLVELAIVLVIIGLLIGGILVAQSMINTTKIQSQVRQFGQFDAAVSNFVSRYDQLPGDTALMGATVGNNNGYIADASNYFKTEVGHFWSDLSNTGLSNTKNNGVYTDGSAGVTATSAYVPTPTLNPNAFIYAYGSSSATTPGNYYIVSALTGLAGTAFTFTANTNALKPSDALALDTKMDNGVGSTGNLLGSNGATETTNLLHVQTATSTNCHNAGVYVTGTSTNVCDVAIRIGSSTGDLK